MRYGVFALVLVVGFMTGFLIPVFSDVFVNGWPVTHRYQVGDPLAEMARAVAQLTQPPEITKPPTPDPSIKERPVMIGEPEPPLTMTIDKPLHLDENGCLLRIYAPDWHFACRIAHPRRW